MAAIGKLVSGDNKKKMEEKKTVKIKAIENGPLQISGFIKLVGKDNQEIASEGDVFLCRCGHSQNKPFCDGSHKKYGFRE
jgi:CDGSH iron-sulfur domain-containing protein 3